ncbi:ACHE [Cordylochernes scorpioides]|uniref:Carboxylic ester hydrolase n=1 Tax=Cordylochernes scorpioides TaxID=51811 RepID=A0ABY6KG02_9ARAC|nr:ACHE [Cordylochernes scorpioides]
MGRIRGMRKVSIANKELDIFLGIPYAKPPLGELRFKKPVEIEAYLGEIIAHSFPKACLQVSGLGGWEHYKRLNMSENCLYLNIWVPISKNLNSEPKGVLVWIHGGAFASGSSSESRYNGEMIAAHGDVIVVSMNYRLGAMGFLNGGTQDGPGNMGLYDQNMALRWIRNNIGFFGGNPEMVTLFGESAGGICVGFHLTSPFSKGLFKRAIIQSGVPNMPTNFNYEQTLKFAQNFAQNANCTSANLNIKRNPVPIFNCLRSKSPEELLKAEYEVRNEIKLHALFRPVVGEDFIPYRRLIPLEPEHINDKDLIIGITSDEGSRFVLDHFSDIMSRTKITKSLAYSAFIQYLEATDRWEIMKEKLDAYFRGISEDDYMGVKKAMSALLTDWLFKCPSYEFASLFSARNNDVFFYYFNHMYSGMEMNPDKEWIGVTHFEDIQFIFGHSLRSDMIPNEANYTSNEKKFSLDMIELWSSFAKNG